LCDNYLGWCRQLSCPVRFLHGYFVIFVFLKKIEFLSVSDAWSAFWIFSRSSLALFILTDHHAFHGSEWQVTDKWWGLPEFVPYSLGSSWEIIRTNLQVSIWLFSIIFKGLRTKMIIKWAWILRPKNSKCLEKWWYPPVPMLFFWKWKL